jgi:DNA-binding MarR family transcriptional regulator
MSAKNSLNRKEIIDTLINFGQIESRTSLMFRHAIAQTEGMNVTDMECLDFLGEKGTATAGELAKMTGLTTGAITNVIDRLEKAGFVKRERDNRDRRKVIVRPDMNRNENVRKIYESFLEDILKLLAKYSDEELETIVDWMKSITIIYEKEIEKIKSSE